MHVAIIGVGEVGRCYAKPLKDAGYGLSLCDSEPARATTEMAAAWGLPVYEEPGAWLSSADWVLSCVPGSEALAVVQQLTPHLAPGSCLADLTTANPDVKRDAAQWARDHSVRYVDTAIMGAIKLSGVGTPLLASGDGSGDLRTLIETAGGRIQVIEGGAVGDAISLKFLRSIFTKGMEALAVELLMSAEKQGVREKLYQQLADIDQTPLRSFLDMLVRTHVVHAKRRAHEVQEVQGVMALQGLPSLVLPGVESRFLKTATSLQHHAIEVPEPTVDQALQWLLSTSNAA